MTHEESREEILYITSNIKQFQEVKDIGDYIKNVTHARQSTIAAPGSGRRAGIRLWPRSWSRGDKIALSIAVTGAIALALTILTLLITVGAFAL